MVSLIAPLSQKKWNTFISDMTMRISVGLSLKDSVKKYSRNEK